MRWNAKTDAAGLAILLGAALLIGQPRRAAAQAAPVLELDHVYVVVASGAADAERALRDAGITLFPDTSRHDGQGTASRAAFFANAYLELLWVDSSVAVDSLHRSDLADFVRAAAWRRTGASPFGTGLHFLRGTPAELPIPMRLDSAERLGAGNYYVLLRQPAESLAADMFTMPGERAVTAWIGRFRSRQPAAFTHAFGVQRITAIIIRGPARQIPLAAGLDTRLIRFEQADSSLLIMEFDGATRGETRDLRPALPVLLRR